MKLDEMKLELFSRNKIEKPSQQTSVGCQRSKLLALKFTVILLWQTITAHVANNYYSIICYTSFIHNLLCLLIICALFHRTMQHKIKCMQYSDKNYNRNLKTTTTTVRK